MKNYSATLSCPLPAQKIYQTITESMSQWWTPMSAQFLKTGDRAKTNFGGEAYWVFEAITLDPFKLVELKCVKANYLHTGMTEEMREEWLNTVLKFEISKSSNITKIIFTHEGLTPDMGCYDVCSSGWNHYISKSLNDYLNDKNGRPNSY